jgi:hypothetical protein
MTALRWGVAAAALCAAAFQERRQADPVREAFARAALELEPGREISLRWRSLSFSVEGMRRMRQDSAVRDQMNQRFQLGMQTEFRTPVPLSIHGRRLEPDAYRIGLWMNEAGAFEFTLLLERETVRFPIDLSESRHWFPYLAFSLLPAEEGVCSLVFQWGSEYGRVVFARAG